MISVKLIDKSFIMCGQSAGTGETKMKPQYIEWYTGDHFRDVAVFTDYCLSSVNSIKANIKIAWIIESRVIAPQVYETISRSEVFSLFDCIITHDEFLLKLNPKFKFVPLCGHWIYDNDCKIHPKTKDLSIIASGKTQTVGHKLRHEIIKKYNDNIDGIFGNGYHYIKNKIEGLKDYRFHIVIENLKINYWFTEKLIDAFVTGCIPIYWGCPKISNFFNSKGILVFNSIEEFDYILKNNINETFYKDNINTIKENFNLAKEYLYPEDYFYKMFLEKFMNKTDFLYTFQYEDKVLKYAIVRLLCSINSIKSQRVNIIVINGSNHCIKDILDLVSKKITYIHIPYKIFGAKCRLINYGVKHYINTPYFFLSDIDLIYPPNFVKRVIKIKDKETKGTDKPVRIIFNNKNLVEEFYKHKYADVCKQPTQNVNIAGNGLVHLESFERIRGFNEEMLGYGPEDALLNLRIGKINKYILVKTIETYHLYHERTNIIQEAENVKIWERAKKKLKTDDLKLNDIKANLDKEWGELRD